MDATLLANNSQHCWLLHVASVYTAFFCSVIAEAQRNNVGSVCAALPTFSGPRTRIKHGFLGVCEVFLGCVLPTKHCRSQHCWALLHPFAYIHTETLFFLEFKSSLNELIFPKENKILRKGNRNKTIYIICKNYKLYITQYFKLFTIWASSLVHWQ